MTAVYTPSSDSRIDAVSFSGQRRRRRTTDRFMLGAAALATALTATFAAPALAGTAPGRGGDNAAAVAAVPPAVAEWSAAVWSASKAGDEAKVDALLASPPADVTAGTLSRLGEMVAVRGEHASSTSRSIADDIARKRTELRRALDADDLTRAMVAAANLKFLCLEWVCELENKDIAEAMKRAEKTAAEAEAAGDLLMAQEMYYRLRGLYESTPSAERYRHWDRKLDTVSRQIGLLASYAPKQLAELRKVAMTRVRASALAAAQDAAADAKAEGRELDEATKSALKAAEEEEEALAGYEPTGDEWREEVQGISQPMLLESLRKLAGEHVSNLGWKPLLAGSLDAMELVGSTPALSETFPKLGDEAARRRWLASVDAQRAVLQATGPDEVHRDVYRGILAALMTANAASLELPSEVLLKEFGDGATHVLARDHEDPYSDIIWPESLRRFKQSVDGKLIGVGIQIRHDEKRDIVVAMPLEGSPAMRAGVRPDDRIVAVDGEPTLGWSLNRAVDRITGKVGEHVSLTLRRTDTEGETSLVTLDLERQPIKLRSVYGWWKDSLDAESNPVWRWFIDPAAGIGYIRLGSFNEETYSDFLRAIDAMRAERPLNGLILDLRNNPGGLLQSAVDFVNLFVEHGEIVSCQDRLGKKVPKMTRSAHPNRAHSILKRTPLVVLINEGSASASEIVAGSLQAYGAAVVVGQRSFGKGSVQEVAPVSDVPEHGALVKYTTHHYVLPTDFGHGPGRLVHKRPGAEDWGVNPHLGVRMSPDQIEKTQRLRTNADAIDEGSPDKERPNIDELLTEGLDPQLELALLILEARVIPEVLQGSDAASIARGGK